MEMFEYVAVLTSIIIGLGITHLPTSDSGRSLTDPQSSIGPEVTLRAGEVDGPAAPSEIPEIYSFGDARPLNSTATSSDGPLAAPRGWCS